MSPFCMYQLTHFVLKATHLIFVQLESFQQWFVGLLQKIRWLVSTTETCLEFRQKAKDMISLFLNVPANSSGEETPAIGSTLNHHQTTKSELLTKNKQVSKTPISNKKVESLSASDQGQPCEYNMGNQESDDPARYIVRRLRCVYIRASRKSSRDYWLRAMIFGMSEYR